MLLEDSVDTWLSMLRQASDERTFISPAMSAKWATRLLTNRTIGPLLDGAKFEQYVHAHGYWSVWNEDELELQIGRLLMHHPDKGDPTMVLGILKRHVESENLAINDSLAPANARGNGLMFMTLVDLAQLLARQGSQEEARWVLDFGREHIPDYFKRRKVAIDTEAGDLYQRKAHSGEIAAGLADEKGNLKPRVGTTLLPGAQLIFSRPS